MTDRDKQIIDLYLNHPELTTKEIGERFNVGVGTVARIARVNNIPRRTGTNNKTKLSDIEIKEIKEKYLSGISLIQLERDYKISYYRVKDIVKDCPQTSIAKMKNHNIIEDYFEDINTPEKAYWLGWIVSDGAITNNPEKGKFQLEITLKQEDEDILQLFAEDLQVEDKIYTSGGKYKRFSLGCKKIVQDLEKLGIGPNKSFTVKVPSFPSDFNQAFIRGVFDGDGGFTHYTRKNDRVCNELSFCGNKYIVSWIRETLLKEIPNLSPNKMTNERSIKRVRWSSKKDIQLLFNYLYYDCGNHFLKRKYNLIYANTEVTS